MSQPPASDQGYLARLLVHVRRHRRGLLFVLAVVLAVVFVAENNKDVTTHFVFFTVTAKLWVGLVVCLALGALIGYLGATSLRRRPHG